MPVQNKVPMDPVFVPRVHPHWSWLSHPPDKLSGFLVEAAGASSSHPYTPTLRYWRLDCDHDCQAEEIIFVIYCGTVCNDLLPSSLK